MRRVAVALLPLPFLSAATTYNWNSKIRNTLAIGRKWKFNQRIQALQFRFEFGHRRELSKATVGMEQMDHGFSEL